MRIEPAPDFGGDDKWFTPLLAKLSQQLFAVPVTIPIGGVEKIDSQVKRSIQCCQRYLILHISPCPSDCPRAKTDRGHLPACASKFTVLHHFSYVLEDNQSTPDYFDFFVFGI
jgi:hypothetical protein